MWVDGIYSGLRAENQRLCALVIIGVHAQGEKQLLAIEDGVRESTQSWRELLLNLQARGMNAPAVAIGDGAMGFWAAVEEIYPTTRQQRCWVHKTNNVLNALPKSGQPKAKQALQEIWRAETKAAAVRAFDVFLTTYEAKYPKATACLEKDREEWLTFYAFPASHWQSLRTTNPIESTFGTIRRHFILFISKGFHEVFCALFFRAGPCGWLNGACPRAVYTPARYWCSLSGVRD